MQKRASMKLTDNLLRRLPTPERGNKITWDDALKGFGGRVTAAGASAFVLDYRRKSDGRQRRFTIGGYPHLERGGGARGGQAAQTQYRRRR
jgi:hypothetical protein